MVKIRYGCYLKKKTSCQFMFIGICLHRFICMYIGLYKFPTYYFLRDFFGILLHWIFCIFFTAVILSSLKMFIC